MGLFAIPETAALARCKQNYTRGPVFVLCVSGAREIHNGISKGLFARPDDSVYLTADLNVAQPLYTALLLVIIYPGNKEPLSFGEHFRMAHP